MTATTRDHRDFVIEAFAADEAGLLEHCRELAADREAYRLVAIEALARLAAETRDHRATRERLARLLDEYRALRAQVMGKAAA